MHGQNEKGGYNDVYSWTSNELALKPGMISGSGSFLSPSLAVAVAALALLTTSGSAKRTGG